MVEFNPAIIRERRFAAWAITRPYFWRFLALHILIRARTITVMLQCRFYFLLALSNSLMRFRSYVCDMTRGGGGDFPLSSLWGMDPEVENTIYFPLQVSSYESWWETIGVSVGYSVIG